MIRYCLFFIFSIFFVSLSARQITVCADCPVKSVREGIALARSGDEVIVESGMYPENNLVIDKSIRLQGRNRPVIDGRGSQGHILQILSDSVSVSGFLLRNVGHSYTKEYAAIHLSKVRHFAIQDMELEKVFFGILVEKSHEGLISGNHISGEAVSEAGSGNGIHLWYCSRVDIRQNEVSGVRDGIYFEFVSDSRIEDNFCHNNIRYGLHFMFSNGDAYHGNRFTRNGAGVAVMFSKEIDMTHNRFYKNWGTASYGLLLKEIYDAEIHDNHFEENTIGINLEGSTRINYQNNHFVRNGWAVKIAGACYANRFHSNNFMHNSFDISYNGNINDNEFHGNYWSTYSGYDLDRDGIGDVPYRPVKLFSYIVNRTPETLVLLKSFFVDLINFSEKVSPVFTPDKLIDNQPLMKQIP